MTDVQEDPASDDLPDGAFTRARLSKVLGDPHRKSLWRMAVEIVSLWRETGRRPGHYLRHFLYRKHVTDPHGFLSESDRYAIWRSFRSIPTEPVLTDKVLFHQHFRGVSGVRLPRQYGHTADERFHRADGTSRPLDTKEDLRDEVGRLLALAREHGGCAVFAKPARGAGSAGLHRLTCADDADPLWEDLSEDEYVVQENLEQHPVLAAFIPDVLNTLRLTTFRRGTEEPQIACVRLRVGRSGCLGDCEHPGGLIVKVHDDGRLAPYSWTRWEAGGDSYTHHPDTGARVGGVQIPAWNEVVEMTLAAARAIEYPIVGWDVGLTVNGPILIEGNARANYFTDEIALGAGFRTHPILGPFVCETIAAWRVVSSPNVS